MKFEPVAWFMVGVFGRLMFVDFGLPVLCRRSGGVERLPVKVDGKQSEI
jgi:hypothetical protein